ncbi:MAG: DUF4247 domain-containing protein [Actinomycetota bacterium]|nr:DUF4247 domain-containing protein [Actinomycetota bacterium]
MTAARVLVLLVLLLVPGCADEDDRVRDHLSDRYGTPAGVGDVQTWRAPDPVATVAEDLAEAVEPAARAADDGAEYLRYDDDIVVVTAAPGGGSTVRAEDLDERYRRGGYAFLGPGFTPGSPAGGADDGGPGDVK